MILMRGFPEVCGQFEYFFIYYILTKTSHLKAWSHLRTDMYRRENGLKYAEFGYPVTKFISSAAQSSRDWHVEPKSQAMTVRAPDM